MSEQVTPARKLQVGDEVVVVPRSRDEQARSGVVTQVRGRWAMVDSFTCWFDSETGWEDAGSHPSTRRAWHVAAGERGPAGQLVALDEETS